MGTTSLTTAQRLQLREQTPKLPRDSAKIRSRVYVLPIVLKRQLDQLSLRDVFDQSVLTNEQELTHELHKREEVLK